MIAEKMKPYVKNNSAIRMMFEEGNVSEPSMGQTKFMILALGIRAFRHRSV